jgi:predicted outer membrane repeat protein
MNKAPSDHDEPDATGHSPKTFASGILELAKILSPAGGWPHGLDAYCGTTGVCMVRRICSHRSAHLTIGRARSALLASACLAFLALGLLPRAVLAATINVACGDVAGLKAAITSAAPGDTISLAANCTYTLTAVDNTDVFGPNGLPAISTQLTIEGNGATITRSGPQFRFFHVAAAGNLTLDQLMLSNGSLSGGAQNGGAVLVEGGVLIVTGSTLSANSSALGGAVHNVGTVSIRGTTFVGNSSPNVGGAIFDGASGSLAVTNSTFSGNSATNAGGAIHNAASGATVASSTFSGNTAALGGGAIFNGRTGSLTVQNSILTDNSGGNCGTLITVNDGGHNISWPDTTCPGLNLDPMLGPLASNGGPTQTFALLPTSPAIDAVPAVGAGCPSTDQRGISRPQGPSCDIGAFELAVTAAPTPTPAPVPSPPSTGHRPASDARWFRPTGLAGTLGSLIVLALVVQVWRRRSISLGRRRDK